jgi:hypothetical protein
MDLVLDSSPPYTKRCARCKREKPISEFNLHTDTTLFKRQSYCRECQKEYAREHTKGVLAVHPTSETQRSDYNALYGFYKAYRLRLEDYKKKYGDIDERLNFEYMLGL